MRCTGGSSQIWKERQKMRVPVNIRMTEEWVSAWKITSAHTLPAEHIAAHWSKTNPSPPVNTTSVKGSFYGQIVSPRAKIFCTRGLHKSLCWHQCNSSVYKSRKNVRRFECWPTVWCLRGFSSSHQQCVFFDQNWSRKVYFNAICSWFI